MSFYVRHVIVEQASAEIIQADIIQAERIFREFQQDSTDILSIAVRWAKNDWTGDWSSEELDETFTYLMMALPYAELFTIARLTGEVYAIRRLEDGWQTWTQLPREWGDRTLVRRWKTGEAEPSETYIDFPFDISQRPWFAGAVTRREARGRDAALKDLLYISEPYTAVASKETMLTASVAFEDFDGEPTVVGMSVTPRFVSKNIRESKIGHRGMMATLYGDASSKENVVLTGIPAAPGLTTEDDIKRLIMRPYSEMGGPVAALMDQYFEQGDEILHRPIRFESNGRAWWGQLDQRRRPEYDQITAQPRWVAVVVPEDEIQQALPNTNLMVLAATGVVLLLAIVRAVQVASSYSLPMERLVEQGRRMQRLDFTKPTKIDTPIQEISALSETLDGMRRALHSYTSVSEETRIADSIVRSAIPASLPRPDGYQIEAFRQSTEDLGGESFDVLGPIPVVTPSGAQSSDFAMMVIDPRSAGIEAAVLTAQLRTIFRTLSRRGDDAAMVIQSLEACLREDIAASHGIYAWIGRLDGWSHVLEMASVRMETVIHWRSADGKAVEAAGADAALDHRAGSVSLQPGDIICIASNGVVDALNLERERFGRERLEDLIVDHHNLDAADLIARIETAVDAFSQNTRATEGKAIMILKRLALA